MTNAAASEGTVLVFDGEAATYEEHLRRVFPAHRFATATAPQDALALASACEAMIVKPRSISAQLIAAAPRLRWIQSLTAGIERIQTLPNLRPDVVVTTARGVHGPAMAELAMLSLMALSRNYPKLLEQQRAHRWEKRHQSLLFGKTIVIFGVGASGEALAARCKAFGMSVIGVSAARSKVPNFDAIVTRDRFRDVLPEADFLVCLAAYSAATHHIIGRAIFDALKPTAFFVNQSRGEIVDEGALIAALVSNRIAGAALDVFEHEPLSAESPLWDLDNVLITPHVGGFSERYPDLVLPLIVRNMHAFLDGHIDRLENVARMNTRPHLEVPHGPDPSPRNPHRESAAAR